MAFIPVARAACERAPFWLDDTSRPGAAARSTVALMWRRYLKLAHGFTAAHPDDIVKYTAHELRHVCASLLIASGATDMQVANQMGHSMTTHKTTVALQPVGPPSVSSRACPTELTGQTRWGYLDLNQGPLPYQGSALTD
jgi:hypothetical protein